MFFFQYLFYNQYAEISRRGGNSRQAQFNTIILSTALITLLIVVCFIAYDQFYPGFLKKNLSMGGIGGKAVGRLMAAVIGVIMFFILKFFIGSKEWYDKMVDQFEMLSREEQDRLSKKWIALLFYCGFACDWIYRMGIDILEALQFYSLYNLVFPQSFS